ncbi:MAG: hypothetical protein ABH805_01905, partial [Candidatus Nealsonbacteria bacterium]
DVNVYSATPNSNTALVTSDYAQTGGNTPTALATAITYIGWNTAGYNDWTFNASGIAAIDVLGVSKFSVRNANYDAASSTPSWGAGSSSFSAYYADQTGTAQDPKLVVTYSPTSSDVPDWTTGKKGGALEFDGSDAYVSIGDVYNGVKSAEFWIKTSSSTQQVLDLNGSAYIELSSNTITATGWTSPTIFVDGVETSTITANTWHHVVITTGTGINASTVSLGRVSTNYFDGTLDEVKLYSRALSASEVRYYYNRGGPVAHWKMDEGSASTAYDSTENNNDGTLKWMSTSTQGGWVEGKYGSALSFDGTDDYVDITDVSGQVRTISFWVKRADGSNKDIIDLGTPEIKVSSDAIISTGLTSPTYYVDGSRSTALSANVWHHVVIIDTANINASDVDIGKASSNYFYGLIDDVRVYEYVRTQEQIRQDYNAGLSTYFR